MPTVLLWLSVNGGIESASRSLMKSVSRHDGRRQLRRNENVHLALSLTVVNAQQQRPRNATPVFICYRCYDLHSVKLYFELLQADMCSIEAYRPELRRS